MASFYVQNFGCRATQADGAAIERQLEERGLGRASTPTNAEIVVLNTCTVTAAADQDARAAIRRVHRENPAARIVVTGCYAQRSPEELAALPGVAQVIGNSHKHRLAEIALPDTFGSGLHLAVATELENAPEMEPPAPDSFVPLAKLVQADHEHQNGGPHADAAVFVSDIFAHTELLAAPVFDAANERTRPNLKVQDGCDNRCSFCVIPFVRGQSRSLPLDRIVGEIDTLAAAGFRELVISGINLGRWGRDLENSSQPSGVGSRSSAQEPSTAHATLSFASDQGSKRPARELRFEDLIRAILDHTRLEKLRISSVEPMDWSDELIALVASSPRIAKHAHVPMQSGSDAVLRRMHRKYRPWHYREKVEKIRAAMPSAAIGADVMVGFPGETEAEFEQTHRMVEDLPFTYLHVFTYSARPGTPAAALPHQVPAATARLRNRVLRELAAAKKQAFMESFVGQTVEAITLHRSIETTVGTGSTEALTDNYLQLALRGQHPPNRWIAARIQRVENGTLIGCLVQDSAA